MERPNITFPRKGVSWTDFEQRILMSNSVYPKILSPFFQRTVASVATRRTELKNSDVSFQYNTGTVFYINGKVKFDALNVIENTVIFHILLCAKNELTFKEVVDSIASCVTKAGIDSKYSSKENIKDLIKNMLGNGLIVKPKDKDSYALGKYGYIILEEEQPLVGSKYTPEERKDLKDKFTKKSEPIRFLPDTKSDTFNKMVKNDISKETSDRLLSIFNIKPEESTIESTHKDICKVTDESKKDEDLVADVDNFLAEKDRIWDLKELDLKPETIEIVKNIWNDLQDTEKLELSILEKCIMDAFSANPSYMTVGKKFNSGVEVKIINKFKYDESEFVQLEGFGNTLFKVNYDVIMNSKDSDTGVYMRSFTVESRFEDVTGQTYLKVEGIDRLFIAQHKSVLNDMVSASE